MRQLVVNVSDELFELMGGSESLAATFLTQAFVIELVRRRFISSGKAAELLEIDRWDMHDLLNRFEVCATDFKPFR